MNDENIRRRMRALEVAVVAGAGFENNDPTRGVILCLHSSGALMNPILIGPDGVCEKGIKGRDHFALLLDEEELRERAHGQS